MEISRGHAVKWKTVNGTPVVIFAWGLSPTRGGWEPNGPDGMVSKWKNNG
jgi:hypothetical protein